MPHFPHLELHTERLKLRWLDERDTAAQFAIFSDPDVMRFVGAPWTRMAQAEEGIAQALVGYAFRQLDLNRLEADINPVNTASARVRERWFNGDQKEDSAFYGLLRSDWEARKKMLR